MKILIRQRNGEFVQGQRGQRSIVRSLRGSITVEAAYIIPMILLLLLLIIYTVFYYHDKNILNGAAGETAVVGTQIERQKGNTGEDLKSFYLERVKGKLILLRVTAVSVTNDKKQVEVSVKAEKGWMKAFVLQKAEVVRPEEKIRLKRKADSLLEREEP